MREEEVRAEHWEGDLSVEWEKADRPLELGERVISLEGGISELKGYWEDRGLSEHSFFIGSMFIRSPSLIFVLNLKTIWRLKS